MWGGGGQINAAAITIKKNKEIRGPKGPEPLT